MTGSTARCIVHVDMDCFYAQVEGVRLGHDCRTVPYALIQWGNFIAVNYPARAMGVRRFHDTPEDVRQRFPAVHMSHIATLAPGDTVPSYPDKPLIQTHKVSLKPYREASRKIFSILRNSEPGVTVGKAGIDEAYLDVTEAAQLELARVEQERAAAAPGVPLDALRDVLEPETKLIADRTEEMAGFFASRGTTLESVYDGPMRALKRGEAWASGEGSRGYWVREGSTAAERAEADANCLLLCAASRVVARLRARIYADLHYDCSAGIAHNRLLAKCISAAHKPRQQTLLLPDRAASALFDLPLDKVRGFGGKLGDAISEICGGGAVLCRDVWLAPLVVFSQLSGEADGDGEDGPATTRSAISTAGATRAESEAGAHIYFRLRGFSGDGVTNPALPSAVEAGKIFHPACTSLRAAARWLTAAASDLADRFSDYASAVSTRGRMLTVRLTPYPRRAVLKSRPRLLPESEALLSCSTIAESAAAAFRELLETLGLVGVGEEGPARDGNAPVAAMSGATDSSLAGPTLAASSPPDNALPLHQIYITISSLHPVESDRPRNTPTLQALFSAASARSAESSTTITTTTTTEAFFSTRRPQQCRVEVDVGDDDDDEGESDEAETEARVSHCGPPHGTTDATRAPPRKARRMSQASAAVPLPRAGPLDAFCRAAAPTVVAVAGEELVQSSQSSVEALSTTRLSAESLIELSASPQPPPRRTVKQKSEPKDAQIVIIDDSD